MNLTLGTLIVAGIGPTQARDFLAPLAEACPAGLINTPARLAGFIAQCRVESANFTALEENLNYRTPEVLDRTFSAVRGVGDAAHLIKLGPQAIANRVYAGRNGNGDEASGDGWRFRGRGLLQVTGRANYRAVGFEFHPESVALPRGACITAVRFWERNNLNALADSAQWDAITRAVNGPAMLHADLRRQYSEEGLQAFA